MIENVEYLTLDSKICHIKLKTFRLSPQNNYFSALLQCYRSVTKQHVSTKATGYVVVTYIIVFHIKI